MPACMHVSPPKPVTGGGNCRASPGAKLSFRSWQLRGCSLSLISGRWHATVISPPSERPGDPTLSTHYACQTLPSPNVFPLSRLDRSVKTTARHVGSSDAAQLGEAGGGEGGPPIQSRALERGSYGHGSQRLRIGQRGTKMVERISHGVLPDRPSTTRWMAGGHLQVYVTRWRNGFLVKCAILTLHQRGVDYAASYAVG